MAPELFDGAPSLLDLWQPIAAELMTLYGDLQGDSVWPSVTVESLILSHPTKGHVVFLGLTFYAYARQSRARACARTLDLTVSIILLTI